MNPPQSDADFIRLRISRQYLPALEELQNLLNQNTPSATVEWLLARNLLRELKEVKDITPDNRFFNPSDKND